MFDISRLTLGELAKVEELSGQSISQITDAAAPVGKVMAALAYVNKRRHDLTFKWDDALNLTMDEASELLGTTTGDEGEGDAEDPTPAP